MLPQQWHRNIFLFGIIGLAAGMLFGTVPTSVPQIILASNWLLEGCLKKKWTILKNNPFFWVLISLFVIHLIGFLYTQNIQKGLDDLRNKLPIMIIPILFFSTKPLSKKELELLLRVFYVSVTVSSLYCYLVYAGFTKKNIVDIRQASVFMSHIRFSLFITLVIIGLFYSLFKEQRFYIKLLYVITIIWLVGFMYQLEMATGFLCLLFVGFFLIIVFSIQKFKKTISFTIIGMLTLSGVFVFNEARLSSGMFKKDPSKKSNQLLQKTLSGRDYYHDTTIDLAENGTLIYINTNEEEFRREWIKRSSLNIEGKDKKGNNLWYTAIRYMSSKGVSKDSVGVNSLSEQDVKNIENGFSNFNYANNVGLTSRWRELVWEYEKYKRGENPSGHTLMMRLEFWKTAIYIISKQPLFGVGTGDIQDAFDKAYVETNSKLLPEWRLRCHNQYLAIGVAFGGFGIVVFMAYLIYPIIVLRKKLHLLYWPFILIALLSFVTEDTLETQSGVTFFVFFQTLFLWIASCKTEQ